MVRAWLALNKAKFLFSLIWHKDFQNLEKIGFYEVTIASTEQLHEVTRVECGYVPLALQNTNYSSCLELYHFSVL